MAGHRCSDCLATPGRMITVSIYQLGLNGKPMPDLKQGTCCFKGDCEIVNGETFDFCYLFLLKSLQVLKLKWKELPTPKTHHLDLLVTSLCSS